MPRIAIMTVTDDLHGLVIQDRLRTFPDIECDVIEADSTAGHEQGMSWSTVPRSFPPAIPSRDGERIDVANCDLLWLRRWGYPQRAARDLSERAHIEVINESCASTLLGTLLTRFEGTWVSDPAATRRAENKLVQLRAAAAAGFKVPRTLVSQDPCQIRRFCDLLEGQVVIKAVRATPSSQLFTLKARPEHLESDAALRACPTIYQEYIPGRRHIRALCCGDDVHAVTIESTDLDWRQNLDVPLTPVEVEPETKRRLAHVLQFMGLRMGVVDLKVDDECERVWLELNPQGQFLFVEGLTGLDLTGAFSDFLYREAVAASNGRPRTDRPSSVEVS
jgi:glutathione synthase/RimK-type ligase-like ATP-grasp enzyme